EGFSGEGNALIHYDGCPEDAALGAWIRDALPHRLRFEATGVGWPHYQAQFETLGGVVECFIEGAEKRSPSAQFRVNLLGEAIPTSIHGPMLGVPSGQIFLGCTVPAPAALRLDMQAAGQQVAAVLRDQGVLGRCGIHSISVRDRDTSKRYPIEI